MKITRRFTSATENVFDSVKWEKRTSRISDADGSVVFEMNDAEIPADWSQLATDIMVSKYFRKAGVPQKNGSGTGVSPVEENQNTHGRVARATEETGPEKSVKDVINRLAGCWRHWGESHGYFDTREDAQAFFDELAYMLLHQMAAPNSPQWFNTGLNWAYGINGPSQGHWIADATTGEVKLSPDAYSHPQPHACFIQSVDDDLVNQGGIMDLWVREARLFKYGSGTGTNFSSLRGENESLSGGGKSSGLMSWLRIGDRAAGAIKSGGTTRRAAKMVCLDADHPDIEQFVSWKLREELKVAAMVEGMKHLPQEQKDLAESLGLKLTYDFNGEAYYTVSGQNSNNSVRLTDAFFEALETDGDWELINRTDGKVAKTLKARDLWKQICQAAWGCADPGLQYDSTINAWHTCPAGGRIEASNPCSEYMFLNNTACNLASINLIKFYDSDARNFDIDAYEHAIRLWTIVLEISVLMASFPSKEIALESFRYRTLGLGYANLGAMLMQAGIAYDSEEARAVCGTLTAILTGRSYATSSEMAKELGVFASFSENRDAMLRVIRNHRRAAYGVPRDAEAYEELKISPVPIDHKLFRTGCVNISNADELLGRATSAWDIALELGEQYGYRNAQTTVIAPTGTIGLLMDCDTTGVEPDFALVKFKKLAGGGYFKIANASLRPALKALGYDEKQTDEILTYVMGTLSIDTLMGEGKGTLREFLVEHGYTSQELVELENQLPTAFEISFAFNAWSMPEHVLVSLGVEIEKSRSSSSFNGLKLLGLSRSEIELLNRAVCGTQTIEGAPHIKDEHLPVFDCANRCGEKGTRFIATQGHIRMMAAAQPFISGAISKTINLPTEASVEDISDSYRLSWELGLKANALYRDGSKLSQPLSTKADAKDDDATDDEKHARALEAALGEASTAAVEVGEPVTSTSSKSSESKEEIATPPQTITIERIVERIVERPLRRRLPDTRASLTHRFNVAGHEGYLTVGLYENGNPGELFITMSKEGSTIGGLMDCLGTAISVALQYGVPIDSLVKKFEHQRFEPMGMTTSSEIPFAKSLVDYIFRWMGMEFIPGYREANAPKRSRKIDSRPAQTAISNQIETKTRALPSTREKLLKRSVADEEPDTSDGASSPISSGGSLTTAPVKENVRIVEAIQATEEVISENAVETVGEFGALYMANAAMMGDAPACDVCGMITVRSGTCYKCLNCGNSMGCS
ncbi:MAG: adenosylcobalamin-dependent ribonucleoside-diphosphate reductase [Planctomycetes bacterium]|nr:adenosylcobalamin-dependent ribonucleoside-diphosphate reductase [Planctomycetota bacterium]